MWGKKVPDMFWPSVVALVLLTSFADAQSKPKPVTIDEDNWKQVLEGEWMLEFYAPWCPACKSLQSTWEAFAEWGPDLGIKVAHCDVTKAAGLSGRFLVTALPTIYHVKDGVFRQYQGLRDKDVFISFVEEKKWEKVDPVPSWQSPGSIHMSIVSEFFRFSNYLRDLHKTLVEDYGITTWGSYGLFGVCTIIVGALLGLLLVCVIDYLNPPPKNIELLPPKPRVEPEESSDDLSASQDSGDARPGSSNGDRRDSTNDEEDEDEDDDDDGNEEDEDDEEEVIQPPAASGDAAPRRRPRRDD